MKKKDFEFNYSAPTSKEREEIESIKKQYEQKSEKQKSMERLRYLDYKVKTFPKVFSISMGIIGLLIFGLGITFVLEWNIPILGVIIGMIGVIIISFAYPVYSMMFRKLKGKHKDEILFLSKKLLNEE